VVLLDEASTTCGPAAWDAYISRHSESTQYHQYAWSKVITKSFGHRAYYLVALGQRGIAGILPLIFMESRWFGRSMVSLPFVNYGGLLADSPHVENALWNEAQKLGRELEADHIEARHLRMHQVISQRKQHKVTMILSLAATADEQWKLFDPKLRNQIRKAERSELKSSIGGIKELDGFYEVFVQNMRDLGTPVYGRRWFEEILSTFSESAIVCSVKQGARVIGAAIAVTYRDTFEVPWASSLRECRALCPNNQLYWSLIQQAIQAGYKRFDFGRSTPNEGTYKFKEQWGAKPVPLFWEYWTAKQEGLPDLSPKNPKFHLATKVWQHLPVWLTRSVGPHIVRHIP
jgi:FemAB-related protein (PEP-CTERM system-associated)